MKAFNATPLVSGDDIVARTYFKSSVSFLGNIRLQNVYVSSIANIGTGTVTARIGETDNYAEMDKEVLKEYINYCGYSLNG